MATGNYPTAHGGKPVKTGGQVLTAKEQADVRTTLSLPSVGGTLTSSDISDATDPGISMLIAPTVAAQKVLLAIPKIYRATLTQTSTTAPSATVMENTLSAAIVWARTSMGIYTGTLASAFTANKTFVTVGALLVIGDTSQTVVVITSANVVTFTTLSDGSVADALLSVTPVQILVYP